MSRLPDYTGMIWGVLGVLLVIGFIAQAGPVGYAIAFGVVLVYAPPAMAGTGWGWQFGG